MIGAQTPASREGIAQIFDSLRDVVLEKNRRYGDSALVPIGVFNKAGPGVSILARMDDKVGRMVNAADPEDIGLELGRLFERLAAQDRIRKNDLGDLVGYAVLYALSQGWTDFSDQID
jgi:hypothetical protein